MDEPLLTAQNIAGCARQISDADQRRAYLDRVCAGNAELRQQVEALLSSDSPTPTLDTKEDSRDHWVERKALPNKPAEAVGSRIGPYKLLQQIGAGGMGAVFMAEQQQPVRRMVALKVIKAGMDSAQVIARFEAERQALALMDHPHIAKVLDAGTTQSGRPFFVMELVKGIPITKYCDDQRLTLKQRLELFVPVCQAIQHAHQKGIIHRDIKPSNVLVAAYEGKPVPKIIDFGVAKATGGKLTERTLFTGLGGIVGTLEYMSPEQAEFNALDIDTRSDVYSLGVLLYELLTGTTPLTQQRLQQAALTEVLRLIREEEPPRPSLRLSESKDSLASVAAQRHTEPAALVKAMHGEVDWIVMKALEKDRTRRYDTANSLARDIQRYLADEAVEAGPPRTTYLLRKLAWKHRRGLAMAAVLLLLLLVSAIVSTTLAVWALNAEKQARTAKQAAERSEDEARAVLEFFQDTLLSAGRPLGQDGGQGKDVTLRQAVDAAEKEIATAFADRPLVEATIRDTLGATYSYLGEYPQAIRQFERALKLHEAQLGVDHLHSLQSRHNLASACLAAGRTDEAIRLDEQTLKQREAKLGVDHRDTLASRNTLAEAYRAAGRLTDAILLDEQNLKQTEAKLGPDDPDTIDSRNNLANAYNDAGRYAEALPLFEKNLKRCEAKLGPDHPSTLLYRHNLALAYHSNGRTTKALPLLEQTLKQMEDKLGPDHPDTLSCRNTLANGYLEDGRIDAAIHLLEQIRKQREVKLGPDHFDTLASHYNIAYAYHFAGRYTEALPLFEQILKRMEVKLGPDHPNTLFSRNGLAEAYRTAGRLNEAVGLFEQNLKRGEAKLGLDHSNTLIAGNNLAEAYDETGQLTKAEALLRASLPRARRNYGMEGLPTAEVTLELGRILLHQHKYSESESLLRESLKVREAQQPDSWKMFYTRCLLGEALAGQKKNVDAESFLLSGCQGMKERMTKIPQHKMIRLTEAIDRLVRLYEGTGKKAQADNWRRQRDQVRSASAKDSSKQ